jgi:hypothetical protein
VIACGAGRKGDIDPAPEDQNAPVLIYVTNNHGSAVQIFAAGRGTSYRLGTVLPGQMAKFTCGRA